MHQNFKPKIRGTYLVSEEVRKAQLRFAEEYDIILKEVSTLYPELLIHIDSGHVENVITKQQKVKYTTRFINHLNQFMVSMKVVYKYLPEPDNVSQNESPDWIGTMFKVFQSKSNERLWFELVMNELDSDEEFTDNLEDDSKRETFIETNETTYYKKVNGLKTISEQVDGFIHDAITRDNGDEDVEQEDEKEEVEEMEEDFVEDLDDTENIIEDEREKEYEKGHIENIQYDTEFEKEGNDNKSLLRSNKRRKRKKKKRRILVLNDISYQTAVENDCDDKMTQQCDSNTDEVGNCNDNMTYHDKNETKQDVVYESENCNCILRKDEQMLYVECFKGTLGKEDVTFLLQMMKKEEVQSIIIRK
jgi:hypothetical protein